MTRNKNLNPFKKGESGNPNGRPKKTFAQFAQEMRDSGYQSVTKAMFTEAIDALLGLDEKKLTDIIKDTERPMTLRIVAKAMLEKDGFNILEKLLNRSHGTPKQTQDVEVRGGRLMSLEEKDKEVMEGLMLKVRTILRESQNEDDKEEPSA